MPNAGAGAGVFPNGDGDAVVEEPNMDEVFIPLELEENGDGAGACEAVLLPNAGAACFVACGTPPAGADEFVELSRGLGTLYFAANLLNISGSRPCATNLLDIRCRYIHVVP